MKMKWASKPPSLRFPRDKLSQFSLCRPHGEKFHTVSSSRKKRSREVVSALATC